jgi:LEA14-like dessication related protein
MKKNLRTLAVAALVGMTAGACVGRAVRAPVVQLVGVKVGGIGLRGATMIAELNIKNPNSFDIETDSITYELEASNPSDATNWSRVSLGTYSQRVRISDGDETEVEIPIDFSYAGLGGAATGIIERGTFNYRLRGNVFVREPLRRTVPFSRSGNLSLAGAR